MLAVALRPIVLASLCLAGCKSAAAMDSSDIDGAADAAGYVSSDGGACTPGVPRCHGEFGYQTCEQDGTWGTSHSCAGYSENGTSSYCVAIKDASGQAWAACVDPACWYWITKGFLPSPTPVGICLPDGSIKQCSPGGTLSRVDCHGVCTQIGSLDGRALGYCSPACAEGARECLLGPSFRECQDGRWLDPPNVCPGGGACNPTGNGELPDIRCGDTCDPGTSRCSPDLGSIEVCSDSGHWQTDRACALGRCRASGPQAQCQVPATACVNGPGP